MVANIGEHINAIDQKYIRTDLPAIDVGDTVKMRVKVQEADKVRVHPFEGTIIRKTGRGSKGTFTVRKISFGIGVERVFPLHSKMIKKIEVVRRGKVRRAKLYYLRKLKGKAARLKEAR